LPERIDSEIVGIYDVISKRVYKPNIKTLIHFGATNFDARLMRNLFDLEVENDNEG
jgi:hypothetical protein